jgi:hypothetical protein
MSNQFNQRREAIPRDDYDEVTLFTSDAMNVTTSPNTYGTNDDGTRSSNSVPVTTTTTTAASAASTSDDAQFLLPNGEIMNCKNTLQSFDDHAAVQTSQQRNQRHMAAMAAAAGPSTVKPPSAAPDVDPVPMNNTNRHAANNNYNGELLVVPAMVSHRTSSSGRRAPSDDPTIRVQAVPIQSVIVAEGEVFNGEMVVSSPPENATATTTGATTRQRGVAFWIAIALVMVLVGVVAGISVYCVTGNCGTGSSSATTTTSNNVPPTSSSVPNPPVTNEQLATACNFLKVTNLTDCQATTSFSDVTVGNTIPTEIGLLSQLTFLDLRDNQLTGTIPSTLGNLVRLNFLSLSRNQFTGTIPSTLANLTLLDSLWLYDNSQLTGTVPSTLCSLFLLDIYVDCIDVACRCCYSGSTFTSCPTGT